tara:strand:- start:1654 stop:2565 length:912 start_codon:yes stop_codon:yes gene_type:complete
MANRNDPERLEQEANQMMDDLRKQQSEPTAVDTQMAEEEITQEAPDEQPEQVEFEAEAPSEDEDGGEEPSELDVLMSRLDKAERAMKGAQAKMTKSNQEASELRQKNAELVSAVGSLKGQVLDQQRDDSKITQLREDYPDFAPLIDDNEALRAEIGRTNESLTAAERARQSLQDQKLHDAHFAKIESAHPDVSEITQTSDWALWLDAQGADVQHYVDAGSANDVNYVLRKFKDDLRIQAPTPREAALEKAHSAATPKMPKARKQKVGGKKSWTVDDITQMPLHEFEKHKAEILRDMSEGSIRR